MAEKKTAAPSALAVGMIKASLTTEIISVTSANARSYRARSHDNKKVTHPSLIRRRGRHEGGFSHPLR